jgi:hypothetical protein
MLGVLVRLGTLRTNGSKAEAAVTRIPGVPDAMIEEIWNSSDKRDVVMGRRFVPRRVTW